MSWTHKLEDPLTTQQRRKKRVGTVVSVSLAIQATSVTHGKLTWLLCVHSSTPLFSSPLLSYNQSRTSAGGQT